MCENADTIHVARAFGLMSVIVAALVLVLLLMAVNEEGSTYKILSAFILIIVGKFPICHDFVPASGVTECVDNNM